MDSPLKRIAVIDRRLEEVDWGGIALGVFACGTEERCTAIFERVMSRLTGEVRVLGFAETEGDAQVRKNALIFSGSLSDHDWMFPAGATETLIADIQEIVERSGRDGDIFIDLSSMPRAWYLGLIAWFRFSVLSQERRLILGYAGGIYPNSHPLRQIVEVRGVPGTGGVFDVAAPVLAIIGLGLDGGAAHALEERLEPDRVIALISSEDVHGGPNDSVIEANMDLLDHVDGALYAPPLSFSEPFRVLSEYISAVRDENVLCIPLGHKTHVVACTLAGLQFPQASSLSVVSRYSAPFRAEATGKFAFGEVSIVFEEDPTVAS